MNIRNNSGLSALVAIVIIGLSALIMTRMASSSALTNLESEILLSGQTKWQDSLWNCARDTLRIWDLSDTIPSEANSLDSTCRVSNQLSGSEYLIIIELESRELILNVNNESNIEINNWYYK